MARDFVPCGGNARHNFGLFFRHPAENEKSCQAVVFGEQCQEAIGICRNAARIRVPFLDAHLTGVGADVEIVFKVNRKCVFHSPSQKDVAAALLIVHTKFMIGDSCGFQGNPSGMVSATSA